MRRLLPLLALAACNENNLGISNATPEVTITSHLPGDPVVEGIPFVVRAVGGDADSDATDLLATWYAADALQADCTRVPLDADGNTECTVTLVADTQPWRVRVEVRDFRGAVGIAFVDLEVVPQQEGYGAPFADIVAPDDGAVSTEGEPVTFEGQVSDSDDAATALSIEWRTDLDEVISTQAADTSGRTLFVSAGLSPGLHVVTLRATDTDGNYTTDVITHRVNGVPTAPVVEIAPASPASSQDLLAAIVTESVDPEGDPVSYTYEWLRNGVVDPAWTSALVLASATSRADTWTVRVTPHDDDASGPYGTDEVVVTNAPPTVQTATIAPDPAFTDDVLAAVATTADDDGDAVTVTWDWQVNGVSVGVSGDQLDGRVHFDRDDLVQAVATANDGSADSPTVGSNVITVANTPPSAPAVAVAPTTPIEGVDDLVCSIAAPATDADSDPVSYLFSWTVDGVAYPQAGDVGPGTTTWPDDTAAGADTVAGEEWTCAVVAVDTAGDPGAPGSASVTIATDVFLPDYDGTFDVVPDVSYNCAFGLVNINIQQLTFSEVAGTLSVSGAPTVMRQTPSPVDENFSATGIISGGCTETYTVAGTFQDEDHFIGTFSASFTGGQCGLTACTNQVWVIDGYRL